MVGPANQVRHSTTAVRVEQGGFEALRPLGTLLGFGGSAGMYDTLYRSGSHVVAQQKHQLG